MEWLALEAFFSRPLNASVMMIEQSFNVICRELNKYSYFYSFELFYNKFKLDLTPSVTPYLSFCLLVVSLSRATHSQSCNTIKVSKKIVWIGTVGTLIYNFVHIQTVALQYVYFYPWFPSGYNLFKKWRIVRSLASSFIVAWTILFIIDIQPTNFYFLLSKISFVKSWQGLAYTNSGLTNRLIQ